VSPLPFDRMLPFLDSYLPNNEQNSLRRFGPIAVDGIDTRCLFLHVFTATDHATQRTRKLQLVTIKFVIVNYFTLQKLSINYSLISIKS